MNPTLLARLSTAWAVTPNLTFGQLVESVENVAWDLVPQRYCSTRLANLPDHLFEAALNQWINLPVVRKAVAL